MYRKSDFEQALATLKGGGVLLHPTDTIWGLACNAFSLEGIQKIYQIKQRSQDKPLICLLDSTKRLQDYLDGKLTAIGHALCSLPVPTTVIFPNPRASLKHLFVNPEAPTMAFRVVKDSYCKRLIAALGSPIVSTSANISGSPSPQIFSDISEEIKAAVDYISEYRRDDTCRRKPSILYRLIDDIKFERLR